MITHMPPPKAMKPHICRRIRPNGEGAWYVTWMDWFYHGKGKGWGWIEHRTFGYYNFRAAWNAYKGQKKS